MFKRLFNFRNFKPLLYQGLKLNFGFVTYNIPKNFESKQPTDTYFQHINTQYSQTIQDIEDDVDYVKGINIRKFFEDIILEKLKTSGISVMMDINSNETLFNKIFVYIPKDKRVFLSLNPQNFEGFNGFQKYIEYHRIYLDGKLFGQQYKDYRFHIYLDDDQIVISLEKNL